VDIQILDLSKHCLPDLNDEINTLLREKEHWEKHIVELGDCKYAKVGAKMTNLEGN